MAPMAYSENRVADNPSATITGGSKDNPPMRATGWAAPLQSTSASAPNNTRWRTPTASAENGSRPGERAADTETTPRAIQRKLPSETSPPTNPPIAPGHPASRPQHATNGASPITITRLTRDTN